MLWRGYHTQSSPFHSFPNLCHNFTAYLKTVTNDLSRPFLMDVNPVFIKDRFKVHVTVSSMHLGYIPEEKDAQYVLLFEGVRYKNKLSKSSPLRGCNQLLFVIPVNASFSEGDVIRVTLINLTFKRAYLDVQSCVSVPDPNPLPLAVCSYICDYNTIPELRGWIAFQRLMNVSKVVFYQATPVPGFDEAFGALIHEGYVEVVDFTWWRLDIGLPIIYNNQNSQINSCFYRLKYRVKAVELCDVDEYMMSEMFPDNLQGVVQYTRQKYPKMDTLIVASGMEL